MGISYLGELSSHPTPRPSAGNYHLYSLSTDERIYFQNNSAEFDLTELDPDPHSPSHTDGTDDIQDATDSQKGLATSAQITKLDGIETGADVTDTANVTSAGAIMNTVIDAKGDLVVGTASDTASRLAIGQNGKALIADSTETEGTKWGWYAPTTEADRDIYIDGTLGNDVTGDGSVGSPYQTWERVYSELESVKIAHKIRILPVNAETYTEFPGRFKAEKANDTTGEIIFDASHLPWQTVAGPFTVSAANAVGPAEPNDLVPIATEYVVSGQTWTTDEYQGKFIRFITGFFAGYVQPIYRNNNEVITSHANWYGVAVGDTFDIVSAPVVVDVSHPIIFEANLERYTINSGNRFMSFCGFEFKADDSNSNYPFFVKNNSVTFSFCNFVSNALVGMYIKNSVINGLNLPVSTFSKSELTDWFAFAWSIELDDGLTIPDIGKSVIASESNITLLCCRGAFRGNFGTSNLNYSLIRLYDIPDGGRHSLTFVLCDTNTEAIDDHEGDIILTSMTIRNCSEIIDIRGKCHMRAAWISVGTLTGDYAVKVRRFSGISLLDTNSITEIGNLGAINFISTGVTHSAWPTSPGDFFESGGAIVLKELN